MKQATVKYDHSDNISCGILLESIDDLNEYKKIVRNAEHSTMVKFVKSNEPAERLDHVLYGLRPIEKALGSLAVMKGTLKGDNPIYHLGDCGDQYLIGLIKIINEGEKVFINPNGGYCSLKSGSINVLSVEEIDHYSNDVHYYIDKKSKVINLENDAEIEYEAREYMNKNFNRNYSFITELRLLNDRKLKQIFNEFTKIGGNTVYIYTTGRDVEQMYNYSKCAIECGLDKFIFQFNSGMDDKIKEFVSWLKQRAKVKIV